MYAELRKGKFEPDFGPKKNKSRRKNVGQSGLLPRKSSESFFQAVTIKKIP